MNWAKEAAEAIIDDDAILEEADNKRRSRNAMLTIGALAGITGIGAGIYANRDKISNWYNKNIASPSSSGSIMPSTLGTATTGIATARTLGASKTLGRTKGLGTLINKLRGTQSEIGNQGVINELTHGEAPAKGPVWGQNDTAKPLNNFIAQGSTGQDAGVRKGIASLLHYAQPLRDAAGKLITDPTGKPTYNPESFVRRAVQMSPPVKQPWHQNAEAHSGNEVAAALQHIAKATPATPGERATHEQLLKDIAAKVSPAAAEGAVPHGVAQHRATVGSLGRALADYHKGPGRNATAGRAIGRMGVAAAVPWLVNLAHGALAPDQ